MRANNELTNHLLDIDEICRKRIENLVKERVKTENVDKKLKANNQMKWVGKMNYIKQCVEEIVCNEIIYK